MACQHESFVTPFFVYLVMIGLEQLAGDNSVLSVTAA